MQATDHKIAPTRELYTVTIAEIECDAVNNSQIVAFDSSSHIIAGASGAELA